ncbi:CRISPR-associated protein, Cmr5 family [Candidatus Vecturithrix granuli]|uniref:CRISPR type III-B/RAMP module-associated protein Cmr5 n=1 Tax=Vecturithrix granuli TaxID=1499967 RepID=A0A081CAL1_VECG1|nr:CRISPR-associated protein, Cmr5 family [Candidatus Vecturithrix granuli]
MPDTTTIKGIEQGRAKFAYECANQVLTLKNTDDVTTEGVIKNAFTRRLGDKDAKTQEFQDFLADAQSFRKKKPEDRNPVENRIISISEKYGKEYKSYVKKIPMLIKTNGLGATFAFVFSKADEKSPYTLIYQQTKEWLKHDPKGLMQFSEKTELAQELVQRNSAEYRAITIEVLAFFTWLRRFAEGLIEGEVEE